MSVVKAQQITYTREQVISPRYRYRKVFPREGTGNGVPTVDSAGGQQTTLEFPQVVFNPARSFIQIKYAVSAATAGAYQYLPADCIPFFRNVIFSSRDSNGNLVQLDDFHIYSKMVSRYMERNEDLEGRDPVSPLFPCNTLVSQNKRSDGLNGSVNYSEPSYWYTSGLGAALSGTIDIPLRMFYNTLLGVDKDIYLSQISPLILIWNPISSFMFTSTDPYNPSIGAAGIGALTFNVNSCTLFLAEEMEDTVKASIMQEVNSPAGWTIPVPWVRRGIKQVYTATQNLDVQSKYYRSDGRLIKYIFTSLFQSATNNNILNNAAPAPSASTKNNTFYRMLQSARLQDYDYNQSVVASTFTQVGDDWRALRHQLLGSTIANSAIYADNHVWIENFAIANSKDFADKPIENKDDGTPISTDEIIYDVVYTFDQAQTVSAYSYAVTIKDMKVTPTGVDIS